MYRQTQSWVYSVGLIDAMLAALKTIPAAVLLTTPKVELFTSNTPPTPDSAHADFTLATFLGYAPASVVLSGPVNLSNRDQAMIASVTFTATSGAGFVAQSIRGYILTDGVGLFYGGELLAQPVGISIPGDFLELDLILPLVARPVFAA